MKGTEVCPSPVPSQAQRPKRGKAVLTLAAAVGCIQWEGVRFVITQPAAQGSQLPETRFQRGSILNPQDSFSVFHLPSPNVGGLCKRAGLGGKGPG